MPAMNSGAGMTAAAKAASKPPSTCCRTRLELTMRPASIAATRRDTLTCWSAPIVASASSPMCEPNSEAQASPMLLPGAPPSQPPIAAAVLTARASPGAPPTRPIRKASAPDAAPDGGAGGDCRGGPGRAPQQADPKGQGLRMQGRSHFVDETLDREG